MNINEAAQYIGSKASIVKMVRKRIDKGLIDENVDRHQCYYSTDLRDSAILMVSSFLLITRFTRKVKRRVRSIEYM